MPDQTDQSDNLTGRPGAANLEEFDLDGFINGAVRPSKVVPIVRDRDLGGRIATARQEVLDQRARDTDEAAEGRSRRRAATTGSPELEAARALYDELMAKAKGLIAYVRVQDVTSSIRKQARKDAGKEVDLDRFNASIFAHVAQVYAADPREHPDAPGKTLTLTQWVALMDVLGVAQWESLIDAVNEVTQTGVLPDFSLPASLSPDGGMSSKN